MGTLDAVQQEQLKAIGTYLSQIRQEQDRSLEDIAAKTYIPLRLLKAIEAGQERPLPEPVFIQGFIRRYADTLGLDGLDLAQKFPVHVTPLPMVPAAASEPIAEREPRRQEIRQREPRRRETIRQAETYNSIYPDEHALRRRSHRSSVLPYVAAAALVALGGLAIGIVRGISSRQVDEAPQPSVVSPKQPNPVTAPTQSASQIPKAGESPVSSSASPVKPNSTNSSGLNPMSSPSPTLSPTASPTGAASNSPVSIKLNLTDRSWVQVTVDGDVKTEAVLPKGTQQSWAGKQSITVVAGNAGAVSLAANGGTAKVMGASGDVKELTIKPKASP